MAAYDFSIQVNATPTGYAVRASAPSGRAHTDTVFPLSPLELENQLQAVELSLLRGRGGLRRALSDSDVQTQALGRILYDFLFNGDVRALFDLSRLESKRGDQVLRLLLSVEPAELASLPWELLYHNREGEFLALSLSTPVVRLSSAPYAQQTLTVTPPLRVLGVIASPKGWEPLNVGEEQALLERAFAPLQEAGRAELVWMDGQDWRGLQSAMRGGPWHIIHFIGHGGFDKERDEGYIVLCDDAGEEARLYAIELARLVADHPSLRLVFLNACEGATASQDDDLASSAAALVRRSVPAVVAMQYPISDTGAIEFARTFYESLADGLPVDSAVTDARKAVSIVSPHSPEWATPVLFLAAQEGRLFSLKQAVETTPPGLQPEADSTIDDEEPRRWRLLWLVPILAILVLVGWQVSDRMGWFDGPTLATPVADLSTGGPVSNPVNNPDIVPTAVGTIEMQEYESQMAEAMATFEAEESATAAAVTAPLPVTTQTSPDLTVWLHVTFDDLPSILEPTTGLGGMTNLADEAFVPGIAGNGAHFLDRGQFVQIPLSENGKTNLSLQAGEIELWYRPNFDYQENPPARNDHVLLVVGDVYNPPHLTLKMSDRMEIVYLAQWDEQYLARSESPAIQWTKGEWLHIRAAWNRSSPDDAFQLYVNDRRVDVYRTGGGWPFPADGQVNSIFVGSGNINGDLEANGVIDELIVRGPAVEPSPTELLVPTAEPGVLLRTTLDDVESIRAPLAGPSGATTLPTSVFEEGRNGNGVLFGKERGIVVFPLVASGSKSIDFAKGEIDFWYQPAYDHDPASSETRALVVAGHWYSKVQLRLAVLGRLTLSIFDDGSTSLGVRTSLTRSLWKAGEWVHIRAAWDADQTDDPMQLYVNDERVDTDANPRAWQIDDANLPDTLFVGGATEEGILPADGIIDDLIIRSAPVQP